NQAVGELNAHYPGVLDIQDSKLDRQLYVDLIPAGLKNFKGRGIALMVFGIEGIGPENLFTTSKDPPCRAYVYCHERTNPKYAPITRRLETALARIPKPDGFELQSPTPGHCYVKQFAPMQPADLRTTGLIQKRFHDSLDTLVRWYQKHAKAFQ